MRRQGPPDASGGVFCVTKGFLAFLELFVTPGLKGRISTERVAACGHLSLTEISPEKPEYCQSKTPYSLFVSWFTRAYERRAGLHDLQLHTFWLHFTDLEAEASHRFVYSVLCFGSNLYEPSTTRKTFLMKHRPSQWWFKDKFASVVFVNSSIAFVDLAVAAILLADFFIDCWVVT